MNIIDLVALSETLKSRLTHDETMRILPQLLGESGLQIRIDGDRCLTNIGIWPNGCCDVEFLFMNSDRGGFKHYGFSSTEEAANPVLRAIREAIGRA